MNQRPMDHDRFAATAFGLLFSPLLMLLLVIGCGRGDSTTTSVVDPPAPASLENASGSSPEADRVDPPGGIELPPGEIPPPEPPGSPEGGRGLEMPKDSSGAGQGGTPAEPQILYASWDQIQATARSSGKLTVVDLWSLSCEPCLKEFPGLVQINRQMGASVHCVAVNLDFDGRKSRPPQHYADRVSAFLSSVGAADFETYISSTPSDDIFATMQIASLPAVIVYGSDGAIVKAFVDSGDTAGFTYAEDVSPLVADLINH